MYFVVFYFHFIIIIIFGLLAVYYIWKKSRQFITFLYSHSD